MKTHAAHHLLSLQLQILMAAGFATLLCLAPYAARSDELQEGDRLMAAFGGSSSVSDKYLARCKPGQLLAGLDIGVGVENAPDHFGVMSIKPICFTALAPAVAGPLEDYAFRMGGTGFGFRRLVCPGSNPVVTKIDVQIVQEYNAKRLNDDGSGLRRPTPSVNGIALYCGLVDRPQGRHVPGPSFFGKGSPASWYQPSYMHTSNNTCVDNLVGVGISEEASDRLDSLGLICGYPLIAEGRTVKAQGRVKLPGAGAKPAAIDESSDEASSDAASTVRHTPARVAIDESSLAAKGEAIANQDPLAMELRNEQPTDAARRGFDIGMAVAEGQTLPGPGKDKIGASLPQGEQAGFSVAVLFSVDRNKNAKFASIGATIAEVGPNPVVGRVRAAQPDAMHRLGFDIATGIFGDPALGAQGNTAPGPGSLGIRDSLHSSAAYRGFNASMALHLSRTYRHE